MGGTFFWFRPFGPGRGQSQMGKGGWDLEKIFHRQVVNESVFSSFQCPKAFFLSTLRIKMPWRVHSILIIYYPLHAEVNYLIAFLHNWVFFFYFKAEKHLKVRVPFR